MGPRPLTLPLSLHWRLPTNTFNMRFRKKIAQNKIIAHNNFLEKQIVWSTLILYSKFSGGWKLLWPTVRGLVSSVVHSPASETRNTSTNWLHRSSERRTTKWARSCSSCTCAWQPTTHSIHVTSASQWVTRCHLPQGSQSGALPAPRSLPGVGPGKPVPTGGTRDSGPRGAVGAWNGAGSSEVGNWEAGFRKLDALQDADTLLDDCLVTLGIPLIAPVPFCWDSQICSW